MDEVAGGEPLRWSVSSLQSAIRSCWDAATCHTAEVFTEENPALGQCGTTALVLRDFFGGDLVEAEVFTGGERNGYHYWTRLPSGLDIDIASDQFRNGEVVGPGYIRNPTGPLPCKHQAQYDRLSAAVRAAVANPSLRDQAIRV